MKKILLIMLLSNLLLSWDGFDHTNNRFIQIDKTQLIRSGNVIEYMDGNTFKYYNAQVLDVSKSWGKIEVYLYDFEKEENFIASMEE